MKQSWSVLEKLAGKEPFVINRVTLEKSGVSIEGSFDLPPLAKTACDDQVFIAEFIRTHGSIKQMEASFGVSYPTIKNRLNRISKELNLIKIEKQSSSAAVLELLDKGEISPEEAIERLKK